MLDDINQQLRYSFFYLMMCYRVCFFLDPLELEKHYLPGLLHRKVVCLLFSHRVQSLQVEKGGAARINEMFSVARRNVSLPHFIVLYLLMKKY